MHKRYKCVLATLVASLGCAVAVEAAEPTKAERGRYLVLISGCNDCHTAGFMEQNMKIPETEWLKGSSVGFQGPWGTTYGSNLRLVISRMTEAQWLEHARKERLPPMPYWALQQMNTEDLKAIYAYVRSLGAPGAAVPAYVAPGGKVNTPYFVFVPTTDAEVAAGPK